MNRPRLDALTQLPTVALAGLSGVLIGAARWLQTFDDDRPDLEE